MSALYPAAGGVANGPRPGEMLAGATCIAVAALVVGLVAGLAPGLGLAAMGSLAYALLAMASFDGALAVLLVSWAVVPIFVGIDPGGGLPVINLQRVLGAILITVWVARRLVNGQRLVPRTALDAPVGLLVLVMLLVLPFAVFPAKALMKIVSDLIEQVAFFYLSYDVVRRRGAWWLFGIFAGSGLVVAALGFFQAASGIDLFAVFGSVRNYVTIGHAESRMGLPRIFGPFTHPIVFGMFFAQLLPIMLAFATRARGARRQGWFAAALTCVVSSALSLSRGPWVATFVVLMTAGRRQIRRVIMLFAIACAALISQPWIMQDAVLPFRKIVTSSFDQGSDLNGSAMARVLQLYFTVKEVAKRPMTGYGPRWASVDMAGLGIGLDSYPLEMALDSGIPRVVLYYWCFFSALKLFRGRRSQLAADGVIALDACIWSTLGANLVLLSVAGSSTMYLYWSLVGAGVALCGMENAAGGLRDPVTAS